MFTSAVLQCTCLQIFQALLRVIKYHHKHVEHIKLIIFLPRLLPPYCSLNYSKCFPSSNSAGIMWFTLGSCLHFQQKQKKAFLSPVLELWAARTWPVYGGCTDNAEFKVDQEWYLLKLCPAPRQVQHQLLIPRGGLWWSLEGSGFSKLCAPTSWIPLQACGGFHSSLWLTIPHTPYTL